MDVISIQENDNQIDELKIENEKKEGLKKVLESKGLDNYEVDSIISNINNEVKYINGFKLDYNYKTEESSWDKGESMMDAHIDTGLSDFTGDINEGSNDELIAFTKLKDNFNNIIDTFVEGIDKNTIVDFDTMQATFGNVSNSDVISGIINKKEESLIKISNANNEEGNSGGIGGMLMRMTGLDKRNAKYNAAYAAMGYDPLKQKN